MNEQQRMVPVEFKPCPFCGKPPRYLGHKAGFWSERVICDECSFHLPPEDWKKRAIIDGPGVEPVVTILTPDPYDEREGPWFDLDGLVRLRKLQSGTKLYVAAPSAPVARCHECGKLASDGWALYCVKCAEKIAPAKSCECEGYPGIAHDFEAAKRRIVELEEKLATAVPDRALGELLAVIHRDGGQYVAAHGLRQALVDALAVVQEDRSRLAMVQAVPDVEEENEAVRMFLAMYGAQSCTIAGMRDHLRRAGFAGHWPAWANTEEGHLTKAGAQSWLRYLFAAPQPPATAQPSAVACPLVGDPEGRN